MNFGLPKRRQPASRATLQNPGRAVLEDFSVPDAGWETLAGLVKVVVQGQQELLEVDAEFGPKVLQPDGGTTFFEFHNINAAQRSEVELPQKRWKDYTSSEKKVMAHLAAKKNQQMRSWVAPQAGQLDLIAQRQAAVEAEEREVARLADRCKVERARPPIFWPGVSMEAVMGNHQKLCVGLFYAIEFPWTAQMLEDFGPSWLTDAFHRAGSLEKSNRVISMRIDKSVKITAGNNAGKFVFDVRYAKDRSSLHTKLFAKVPFPMTHETKQDRISSSVLKWGMDFFEINTYRLAETTLPMKTPKFYFGDISPESSNYILITERVPFVDMDGRKKGCELKPFEIEGPYDKCKDWELRGSAKEYYTIIMQASAKIAAADKSGDMGTQEFLGVSFAKPAGSPDRPEQWGVNPSAASGGAPQATQSKLKAAVQFFSETAAVVFPAYVKRKEFIDKFMSTMMTLSAYSAEIEWWKHQDSDFVALAHANLNVDNAYFWRDEEGQLDCGVLDWGGFGAGCLGHKIWWYLNCAEWDTIEQHLRHLIDIFVATYRDCGGPALDADVVERMVKITCLSNLMFMVSAVPDCLRQCPAKEWATIRDRHDPRISENIGGKSTLRTTLRVMDNGLRMIEELQADQTLRDWIKEFWVEKNGRQPKSDDIIFG
eukprot:TRINITY_DN16543_c0_g1_i1.p1 TRINITY_DN16543_c0_g1~~TRINITY_DN16543_c0_g1_i1.p1  ORF type:complete len:655 (+),score=120.22 TRINITY_DN16543_c0_g1_i1:34-1998(+)